MDFHDFDTDRNFPGKTSTVLPFFLLSLRVPFLFDCDISANQARNCDFGDETEITSEEREFGVGWGMIK